MHTGVKVIDVAGSQGQNCSSSNWVRCGATLVDCEAACDTNILGSLCTNCLGGEHDECVYCLPQIAGSNLTAENIGMNVLLLSATINIFV